MSENLYRVADRDALERLRAVGARILHRFPGYVILREPFDREIDGVTPVDSRALVIPAHVRPEEIGEVAFAIRQSDAYRAQGAAPPCRREHRRHHRRHRRQPPVRLP